MGAKRLMFWSGLAGVAVNGLCLAVAGVGGLNVVSLAVCMAVAGHACLLKAGLFRADEEQQGGLQPPLVTHVGTDVREWVKERQHQQGQGQ